MGEVCDDGDRVRDCIGVGRRGLTITLARFGVEGTPDAQCLDVTAQARSCTVAGSFRIRPGVDFGEPAPGRHKSLVIEGAYGGTPIPAKVLDAGIDALRLGLPPSPK